MSAKRLSQNAEQVERELKRRPSRESLDILGVDKEPYNVRVNKGRKSLQKQMAADEIEKTLETRDKANVVLKNVSVSEVEYNELSGAMPGKAATIEPKIKRDKLDKELSVRKSMAHYYERNSIPRSDVLVPQDQPEWVKSQVKSFVRWANFKLFRAGFEPVYDINNDFKDGFKLAHLLNATLSTPMPSFAKKERKTNTNPKLEHIHNLDRMGQVFHNMKKDLDASLMKEDNIVEGELKDKLSLIWKIILTYNEKNLSEEEKNIEKAIHIWINKILKEKKYHGLSSFKRIKKDLRSGLILSAMLHYFDDHCLNYDKVYQDMQDGKETNKDRLVRAIEVAEKKFGIPALIDAEDIDMDEPDSKALITYLSEWISAFTKTHRMKQAYQLVQEFVRLQMKLDGLTRDYKTHADTFVDFCNEKIRFFDSVALVGENIAETKDNLRRFENYFTTEKNKQAVKLIGLSSTYMEIATLAKTNGRKVSDIDNEILPAQLESLSNKLTTAENGYLKRLNVKMESYFSDKTGKSTELTPEMIRDIESTFDVFDASREGHLVEMKFNSALQAVGLIPSKHAWHTVLKSKKNDEALAKEKSGINKESFVAYCVEKLSMKDDLDGIINAFQLLSRAVDKKTLLVNDLSGGLDEEVFNFAVDKMRGKDNKLNYETYVKGVYKGKE